MSPLNGVRALFGPITDPDNYRGITLLLCTSKLFTACFNSRLSRYVDDNIIGKEQAGFRAHN